MGRPRSNFECPKCHKQGYIEHNASRNGNYKNSRYRKYWRTVHYDSITKKKNFCYIDDILQNLETRELMFKVHRKLNTLSPTELQNYYADLEPRYRLLLNNLKREKETAECIAIEKGIELLK